MNRFYSKDEKHQKLDFSNEKHNIRIKNHHNSVKRQKTNTFSPNKKDMIKSLYGHSFGHASGRPSDPSIFASTIHKFPKISENMVSRKETEFKDKNRRHYNEVVKFETAIKNTQNNKLNILGMRIDGTKDRLYERKNGGKGF